MWPNFVKRLCECLPDGIAWRLATFLASIPTSRRMSRQQREAMQQFERFRFGPRGGLVGYTMGYGPTVILAHGWAGKAAQLAALANRLVLCGFQVVLFDAYAHGASRGFRISFDGIVDSLTALFHHMPGPPHAIVGHSAGGLAMMLARERHGIVSDNFVCIAAPLYPYPPIDALRKRLGLSDRALRHCRRYYARQCGKSWQDLKAGAAFGSPMGRLLLVYDQHDDQIRLQDVNAILRQWPRTLTLVTSGVAHHRLPRDNGAIEAIGRFLALDSRPDRPQRSAQLTAS